ncbi:MAG: efflux RND transporter periplasmic adaptor subunit [Brotaphodocola sp.]
MKKSVVIAGAAVALVAIVAIPQILRSRTTVEEAAVPVVEVATPEPGSIELFRGIVGKVEPADVVYIYPKAAGEVTDVFVKAGDTVEVGQALCNIDTKQVEAARLSMESAKAAADNANATLARQQVLFAAGDIAPATFESVQTQARAAQIQYEQAKLNYDYQMEFSHITATIAGKIESFNVEVHDNVASSVLIGVIAGEGSQAVSFSVPEKIVKQMSLGDEIRIEKNGSEYKGTITDINNAIDDSTGLFKVKATVENGDALPTGSQVKLYVTSDKAENVMTLPVDTVYYSGGDAYVYTFDEGTVHQVPVEVGIYDSELIQIISGIEESTQVISTWSSELYEGSRVQIASAEEQTEQETAKAE